MMNYSMEKYMATFLVRDIVTDFMLYTKKNKLTKIDLEDFAVADDFATKYVEEDDVLILKYKIKPLKEIKEDLDEIVFSKAFADGLTNGLNVNSALGKDLSKVFAKLMELRNKVDRDLPSDEDEENEGT